MKNIVLNTIFVIIPIFNFSQNINIEYKIGGYGFGENGKYETYEIYKFYPENKDYKLTFLQLEKSWIYNDSTKMNNKSKIDTLQLVNQKITNKKIQNFLQEVNTNRNNFNFDFIKKNVKNSISKKEIVQICKKRDIYYLIGDEQTNQIDEFGRKKISEIKNLKNFDKYIDYIKPKSDTIDTRIFADAWNFAIIEINKEKIKLDFFKDLGQPFEKENKTFINLEVNKKLLEILPKNSYLRKQIEFESLFENYIYWFLKNYS